MKTGKRRTVQTSIQPLHKTENSVRADSLSERRVPAERSRSREEAVTQASGNDRPGTEDQRSGGTRGSKKINQTTDTKLHLEPRKTQQDITRQNRKQLTSEA